MIHIRISPNTVYTYSNGGDIAEFDIVGVVEGTLRDNALEAMRLTHLKYTDREEIANEV